MFANYHPHPSNAIEGGTVVSGTAIAVMNPGGVDNLESNGSGALKVAVVSGSGGTEYTEGDTDSSITGFAILWEDTGDTLRTVSASKPLPVTVTSAIITNFEGDTSDLDSGAGTDDHAVMAIGVAASGGHATITGDAANGLDVDVTRVGGTVAVTQSGTWDEVGINDSGNSITVDGTVSVSGTVAVTQSGTWDEVGINDSGNAITVDWNGTAPPIGGGTEATALKVTIASDSTGVLSVDDNGSSLTVDGTVAVSTLGGTVAVTQSGTWDEVGINDSGNSITVDNGGTFLVQENGAALTSLQLIDDTVFTDDTSTHSTGSTKGIGIMATATPTDTSVNANDIGMIAMTTDRRMLVDASGVAVPITDNSGSLTVDQPTGTNLHMVVDSGTVTTVSTLSDSTQLHPGTAATNLGKAEDAAHSSGDVGVMLLAVREASATDLSAGATDGDYEPLQVSSTGRLWVDPSGVTLTVASHAVTNAGTFVVQENGAALTALQLIDDGVYTDDTSTHSTGSSKGYGIMAAATPTDTSVNANDIGMVAMTTDRRLLVDASGVAVPITDNSGSLTVDQPTGTNLHTVVDSGTITTVTTVTNVTGGTTAHDGAGASINPLAVGGYASAAAPSDVSADNDIVRSWHLRNGAQATVLTAAGALIGGDAANGLDVDVTRLPTLANVTTVGTVTTVSTLSDSTQLHPGTGATNLGKAEDGAHTSGDVGVFALAVANEANTAFAADGDYVPIGTDTEGNVRTVGNRDHDAVDAGEPTKVGMKAVDLGITPTAVAASDRTNWFATRAGIPFVLGGHPNILSQTMNVTDADGAQTDAAIITVAAGTAIVVTKVSVMADHANSGDCSVRIGFGTANVPAVDGAQIILFHPGIAPGSGVIEGTGAGIIGIGASNEDLRVTCEDPVGGGINITVTYFTILIG